MQNEHYYFIDRLKVFLVCIIIFHQSLVAFGGVGQWYYTSANGFRGVSLIVVNTIETINLTVIIPMFFLVSGILAHRSFKRRGFADYVQNRIVRLGIPALVYALFIHPTIRFFVEQVHHTDVSWHEFMFQSVTRDFSFGPMWFVAALLVIEILYAVVKNMKVKGDKFAGDVWRQIPSLRASLFIIMMGVSSFLVRLIFPANASLYSHPGFYPIYLGMFVSGLIDARFNWAERIKLSYSYPWLLFSLICLPILLLSVHYIKDWAPFAGGFNTQSLFLSFWEAMTCIGACIFLTAFFLRFFNNPDPQSPFLASLAFIAFILHPFAIVPLTFVLEPTQMSVWLKWFITSITSCALCFAASYLLHQIHALRKLF